MPEKLARAAAALARSRRASTTCCPLDDRRVERFNSDLAGRPELITGNSQLLFGGMGRLTENAVLNIKNKSHSVTAEIVVPDGGAEGVIIAQGGAFAGWSLYVEGRQAEVLLQPARAAALHDRRRLRRSRPARTRCAWSSPTTAAGSPRAATVTLYVDGEKVGEGRVEATDADGLLGRRDVRRRRRHRHRRSATTTAPRTASSPARSTGCRSTSARTPRTTTT